MKQWEHKIVGVSTLGGMTNDLTLLDRLGSEGWEIVATTGRDGDRAVFKRRKRTKVKTRRKLLERAWPIIESAAGLNMLPKDARELANEIKQEINNDR